LPALHSKVQQVRLVRKVLLDRKAKSARLDRPGRLAGMGCQGNRLSKTRNNLIA
jgi:hypothetical protein